MRLPGGSDQHRLGSAPQWTLRPTSAPAAVADGSGADADQLLSQTGRAGGSAGSGMTSLYRGTRVLLRSTPLTVVYEPALPVRAAWMARHTRSGVAGISMWRTPSSESASTMALMTPASAGVVPPSPPERTPSRLVGEGTSLSAVFSSGKMSARGIA